MVADGGGSIRWSERRAALHWQVTLIAAPVALLIVFGLAFAADHMASAALRRQVLRGLETARLAAAAGAAHWLAATGQSVERAAADPVLAQAATALVAATHAVEDELRTVAAPESAREELKARLLRYYGGTPPIDARRLLPTGRDGVWLQQRYLADGLAARDDGPYGLAHAEWHPRLAELAAGAGFADLLLVRAHDGRVVYSVAKTPLFQTSLLDGAYADSNLGGLVRRLRSATTPALQWADFAPFAPARGQSLAFAGAPLVRNGSTVGLLIAAISPAGLSAALNDGGVLGLGSSADVFASGADGALRSQPRQAGAGAAGPALMAAGGGRGAAFLDEYLDARGVTRLAASAPLDGNDLGWRVTAEVDAAEALRESSAVRARLLLLAVLSAIALLFWIGLAAVWGSAPLRRLVDALARLRPSDPNARLRVPGGGEVAALSAAVNGLLEQQRNTAVSERRRRDGELRGMVAVLDAARAGDCTQRAYAGSEFAALADAVNAVCEHLRDRPNGPAQTSDALNAAAEHLRGEAARHLDVLTTAAEAAEYGGEAEQQAGRLANGAATQFRAAAAAAESGRVAVAAVAESLATLERLAGAGELTAGTLARADAVAALRERLADLSTEMSVLAVNAALAASGSPDTAAAADDAGRIADAAAATCDEMDAVLAGAKEAVAAARDSGAQQAALIEGCSAGAARVQQGAADLQATLAAGLALLDELAAAGGVDPNRPALLGVARDSARRLCNAAEVLAREAMAMATPPGDLIRATAGNGNGRRATATDTE